MTNPFNAILLEGLFYEKEGCFFVEQDGGKHTSLAEVLLPVKDTRVQFAVHHLPPHGLQPGEPGAGSCRFPQGRGCPVRHDQFPDRLLAMHLDGVLRADPWRLEKFDGSVITIPFGGMVGHFGRLAVATILDVEAMRESLAHLDPTALASSGLGVADLERLLDRLRKSAGN